MLIFGGVDLPYQRYFSDVWAFDVKRYDWTQIIVRQPAIFDARSHCLSHAVLAAARGGSRLLRVGGGRYFEGVYCNEAALLGEPADDAAAEAAGPLLERAAGPGGTQ